MILIFMGIAVALFMSVVYKKATNTAKWRKRHTRRNKIIRQSWRLVNEIEKWRYEHPQCSVTKGVTIFKGGSNLMTTAEFTNALRQ